MGIISVSVSYLTRNSTVKMIFDALEINDLKIISRTKEEIKNKILENESFLKCLSYEFCKSYNLSPILFFIFCNYDELELQMLIEITILFKQGVLEEEYFSDISSKLLSGLIDAKSCSIEILEHLGVKFPNGTEKKNPFFCYLEFAYMLDCFPLLRSTYKLNKTEDSEEINFEQIINKKVCKLEKETILKLLSKVRNSKSLIVMVKSTLIYLSNYSDRHLYLSLSNLNLSKIKDRKMVINLLDLIAEYLNGEKYVLAEINYLILRMQC